jgi:GNAT superfamily N-acetyltransferase
MEIRGARESELDEVVDLQCLVYRPDGHERYRRYVREDPSYRPDQTRVVVVNGRVVASLRVWERRMRIGSCIVRMGGVGSVCTHPDYRRVGYATALMKDAVSYMRAVGYDLSVLFSIIPQRFYRKLGWASVPLAKFRVTQRQAAKPSETDWQVPPFDEGRDLEQVIALYDAYNAHQSGSIVRTRAYWRSGPSRIRQILPTIVARCGETLGGYLNYQTSEKQAHILEVAYNRDKPTALIALVDQLLRVCEQKQIEEIHGEMPHWHPLVDLLVEKSMGDLSPTGDAKMMLYPVNLPVLLRQLLPDLQSRLNAANRKFPPTALAFVVNEQRAVLRLHDSGELQVFNEHTNAIELPLPGHIFWRALLGESSWLRLESSLAMLSVTVTADASALLSILFPQQDVIFWGPDYY